MHINDAESSLQFCVMLSIQLKEATKVAHQELEKTVVLRLKTIRSDSDYAAVLKCFYAYFSAIEHAIAPYINPSNLGDYQNRRNSSYLQKDIQDLGGNIEALPEVSIPTIQSTADAFAALYVLEGSIMGGPYIVQMLQKYGLSKGFSFFSGYGEQSQAMWQLFTTALNSVAKDADTELHMIARANETFDRFGDVFQKQPTAV